MNTTKLLLWGGVAAVVWFLLKGPKGPTATHPQANGGPAGLSRSPISTVSDYVTRYTQLGQQSSKALQDGTASAAALVTAGSGALSSIAGVFKSFGGGSTAADPNAILDDPNFAEDPTTNSFNDSPWSIPDYAGDPTLDPANFAEA